jgi:hypothetical protein
MRHLLTKFKSFVSASVLLLTTSVAYSAELAMIPEKVKTLKSPDGAHVVFDVNRGFTPEGEQNRELCFQRKGEKAKQRLLTYHRSLDVAWCPNSSMFVVNDNTGSSEVIPYLYNVKDLKHPVEVTPLLMRSVTDKNDKLSIQQSDMFLLIYASRWINPNALEVTVRGAGAKSGCFKIMYEWDLKGSFKKLKRVNE